MQFSASETMCYLAENIHFFAFHTNSARTFKHKLQTWWASAERNQEEAQQLHTAFLELSEADPLEAGCGWFRRISDLMSPSLNMKLQLLEQQLSTTTELFPVCEISARCMEGHYLRSQNCFLGQLNKAEQERLSEPLMQSWQEKLMLTLQTVKEQLTLHRDTLKKATYAAIYTKDDNFIEPKSLVQAAYSAVALWLLPGWLRMLFTALSTLFTGFFDWQLAAMVVRQMPESHGLPLFLLAALLVVEVIGLIGIPQTVWEVYFLLYRRLAMCILWLRFQRSRHHIRILMRKTELLGRAMLWKRYQWTACPKPTFGALAFQMPKWVTIGDNPFFYVKSIDELFTSTLRIFPQFPRPGMQTRTIPKNSAWYRTGLCAILAAVFLMDLPELIRSVLL